jgi:hypothetical protein
MGKQYKKLTKKDIDFIKIQKLFYIASASGNEVNLSPKGYDSIRVLDDSSLVFLDYVGSGNRTYTDAKNGGEFTILFNAFEGKPKILRIFCKAKITKEKSKKFKKFLKLFKEKKSLVRTFFVFKIYAVETSCGAGVPYMSYKKDRNSMKKWMVRLDKNNKLEAYKKSHFIPPSLKNLK